MGYAFVHGATAYTPDGKLPTSVDAEAHNAALEAAELEQWATAPERSAAYIVERESSSVRCRCVFGAVCIQLTLPSSWRPFRSLPRASRRSWEADT